LGERQGRNILEQSPRPESEVLMAAGKISAHDADSDVGLVRRLLAAQFPQWAAQPIERVPSTGTDHALYRLGDDQVVRLPLACRAAKGLDKELTWLPRLAPLLPVAIPVVLGTGLPAEGYLLPWAVYRWLDGENPRIDHIADPDVLATDLAAFIAALQRVDLADGPAAYRGGPLATQDGDTRAALADLGGWSTPRRRPRRGIPRCGRRSGLARRSGFMPTSCQAMSWSARDG
jgi:aminoglycoside phosphotransferase (APT) family kinase protein